MDQSLRAKYDDLRKILKEYGSVAVAFSGGVDSSLLLFVAHEVLGDDCLALTARSPLFPQREMDEAVDFCQRIGVEQLMVDFDELEVEGFANNPPDRCYRCKKGLFEQLLSIAQSRGLKGVAEGSNMDDLGDYRPGLQAVGELGILSPLREARLSKDEIRALSHEFGLPTWDKPSFACLASRFVYGQTIDHEKLKRVERAEQLLLDQGFRQVRVRIHGDLARVELEPESIPRLMDESLRPSIVKTLNELGFTYVTLDLSGYRTGSMNDGIAAGQ